MTDAASPALQTALAYYQAWTSHDLDKAMSYVADGIVCDAPAGRSRIMSDSRLVLEKGTMTPMRARARPFMAFLSARLICFSFLRSGFEPDLADHAPVVLEVALDDDVDQEIQEAADVAPRQAAATATLLHQQHQLLEG